MSTIYSLDVTNFQSVIFALNVSIIFTVFGVIIRDVHKSVINSSFTINNEIIFISAAKQQ